MDAILKQVNRSEMANSYARAIEIEALTRGYEGVLAVESESVKGASKLREYVARFAYAHTTNDVMYLLHIVSNHHFEMLDKYLIECIENLNVHECVMTAIAEHRNRGAHLSKIK